MEDDMRRNYFGIVLGLILAGISVVLLNLYVHRPAERPLAPMATVVVAARTIPFGTHLGPDYLTMVAWPRASVPQGAFATINDIFKDAKTTADRIAIVALEKGEPILKSKISGFGARSIMSTRVEAGMRAISIHIDSVSGVSGFILPGDHVDVLLTRNLGTGARDLVTDVILQDVEVLGINQLSDQDTEKPVVGQTATVEVTPEQVQKLVLAQQAGTLSLALRNMDTLDKVAASRVTEGDLTNPRPHSQAPHVPEVRVRYGAAAVINAPIPLD
jgi:pilus assembly protein CpaB